MDYSTKIEDEFDMSKYFQEFPFRMNDYSSGNCFYNIEKVNKCGFNESDNVTPSETDISDSLEESFENQVEDKTEESFKEEEEPAPPEPPQKEQEKEQGQGPS